MNKLWRQVIGVLFGWKCANPRCGARGKSLDAHHIFHRRTRGGVFMWNPQNGAYLCRRCHGIADTDPVQLMDWLEVSRPETAAWVYAYKDDKKFRYVDRFKEVNHLTRILERQNDE